MNTEKKAYQIAREGGRAASLLSSNIIEVEAEEKCRFFMEIDPNNVRPCFIPPFEKGMIVEHCDNLDGYTLWEAADEGDIVHYIVKGYKKAEGKPLLFEFSAEIEIGSTIPGRYTEYKLKGIDTAYATALELQGKTAQIRPYLDEYVHKKLSPIMSSFFRTIAWFNFLLENPDYKQAKKTESGVNMNGMHITTPPDTAKKIRSRQIHRVCSLWTVSGHYRHYKDGRIVYIKPYLKGKNKKALEK